MVGFFCGFKRNRTNVLHTFQQSHHTGVQQDAGCKLTSGQQAAADFFVTHLVISKGANKICMFRVPKKKPLPAWAGHCTKHMRVFLNETPWSVNSSL